MQPALLPRLLLLILCLAAAGPAARAEDTIRIGVLAFRGPEQAMAAWSPTAEALDAALPGHGVVLLPMTLDTMREAVADEAVDFVLTNPGHYVELETAYGITHIATVESSETGTPRAAVGAVLFTRADRTEIQSLADIKGRVLEAVSPRAFGGFQIAWRELKDAGIDPFTDLKKLRFAGFPLDAIVLHVRDGVVDVGTVRACLLEQMAAEGTVDLADFHVLNARPEAGLPCLLSSRLYPDWPFAKLRHTDRQLAKQVAIALLGLGTSDAARAAGVAEWTVPLSYQPVYDLYADLGIGPFASAPGDVLSGVLARHWIWPAAGVALLVLAALFHLRTERLVRKRSAALRQEMEDRRKAQEEAQMRLVELAYVCRRSTLGELAAGLSHEINAPLTAITSTANGCIRRMEDAARADAAEVVTVHGAAEVLAALRGVVQEAQRAAAILASMRAFLRDDHESRAPLDVNALLRDAADLLAVEMRHGHVTVNLDLTDPLPPVLADRVHLEQVMVNIIHNAIEALQAVPVQDRLLLLRTAAEDDGRWVLVAVRDTGPGLSEEARQRLFEPFYTTKSAGMGLGLSISQSIVKNHGGWIGVDSGPPRPGTTVTVRLPAWLGDG